MLAVGGFQHETNVFASSPTTYESFEMHDGWPGLTRGPALVGAVAGINLPITGFCDAASAAGFSLAPLLWASAEPAAHVSRDAFDRISTMICTDLLESLPRLAGVYLDLHGAMVTQDHDDGEAELLRRVRSVIGALPLVVSLDWHANLSREAFELCDAIAIFRTYPHLDMATTGARCFRLLERRLHLGRPLCRAYHDIDYLIPLVAQCHTTEPCATICAAVQTEAGAPGMLSSDFAPGFPASDGPTCRPALVCYGEDSDAVDQSAARLHELIRRSEPRWGCELLDENSAISAALATESPGGSRG